MPQGGAASRMRPKPGRQGGREAGREGGRKHSELGVRVRREGGQPPSEPPEGRRWLGLGPGMGVDSGDIVVSSDACAKGATQAKIF